MMTVTPYTILSSKVDSLSNLADSMLMIQQRQSVKIDSVCGVAKQIAEGQTALQDHAETANTQLQAIADYGIGYSDIVAHITIPLIIALFAFAMPLLFQVITYINNKYSSENISKMFESCWPYKFYWIASIVSIAFLLLFGIATLVSKGGERQVVMTVFNWVSVVVAFGYATAILVFLRTCIRFNAPDKLLGMIGDQYQAELRYDDVKLAAKNIAHLKDKVQFWKSKGWKSFREFAFRSTKLFHHYQTQEDYGKRLVDICKYALDTRNNSLLFSIMMKLDDIIKQEKKSGSIPQKFDAERFQKKNSLMLVKAFYDGITDYYAHAEENTQFEEWIVRRKFSAMRQNGFVWEREFVDTIKSVVVNVEAGHIGFYEQYIHDSGFNYLYIVELANMAYVEGADEGQQKAISEAKKEVWEHLIDLHYVMNAYLYAQGHLEILPILRGVSYYMSGHLYDLLPQEILIRYARCKRQLRYDGGFWHWGAKDLFDRDKVDPEMLDDFTAVLMLLNYTEKIDGSLAVSKENLDSIEKYKAVLVKIMEKWKDDLNLSKDYPYIKKVDCNALIEECVKSYNKTEKSDKDIYGAAVPQECIQLLGYDVHNAFRNIGWMPRGLKENDKKDAIEKDLLQPYTVRMNKEFVLHYGHDDSFHLQRHYEIVFEQRAIYMIYAAISKMQLGKLVKVRTGDFEQFFDKYTKGKNKEYVIIDTDCELDVMLDIDHRDVYGGWEYKGAEYKKVFLDSREYLRDSLLPGVYKNTLLILRKDEYPSLFKINEDVMPQVIIADESDRDSGRAAVRVTVMPNLEMRYYKNSKVLWVELTR